MNSNHPIRWTVFLTLLWSAVFLAPTASARTTSACFTRDEAVQMVVKREEFSKTASQCLKDYWNTHTAFFNKQKYSKYFGNRNPSLNTYQKRRKALMLHLWPELPGLLEGKSKEILAQLKRAQGLDEFENYLKAKYPTTYNDYRNRSAKLMVDERAKDEGGDVNSMRPNNGPQMQNISCVDMARRCLSEGFLKNGMESIWQKVDRVVMGHMGPDGRPGVYGTDLQKALIDLGWESLYWNPDTSKNAEWDTEDKNLVKSTPQQQWQPVWGGHAYHWAIMQSRSEYVVGSDVPIPITDKNLLVNFGTKPPAAFAAIPFFLGTAHSGYHVFPGYQGKVIEAHSMRRMTSISNLEVSDFNPLDNEEQEEESETSLLDSIFHPFRPKPPKKPGGKGGPRWTETEHYRSGVIVVPPGYLGVNGQLIMHEPKLDAQGCVDFFPAKDKGQGQIQGAPPSLTTTPPDIYSFPATKPVN